MAKAYDRPGARACLVGGLGLILIGAAPASASQTSVTDGYWGGAFHRGTARLEVKATQVDGVGRLEVTTRRWEPWGSAMCEYLYRATGAGPEDVVLNGARGTPQNCPDKLAFRLERTGDDTAKVVFGPGGPQPETPVRAAMRPFREQDRRAPVKGLDVLDVKPGDGQADAEKKLAAQGYTHDPADVVTLRSGDWTEENRRYRRTGKPGETDVVTIAWSGGPSSRAMIIRRHWQIPEEVRLSALTLKKALVDKYGPPLDQYGEERAWDRAGRQLASSGQRHEACKSGSRQDVSGVLAAGSSSQKLKVNAYCGPKTAMSIGARASSGLANWLDVTIMDPDELWANEWRRWSMAEKARLQTRFEAVSGASGEAPKL